MTAQSVAAKIFQRNCCRAGGQFYRSGGRRHRQHAGGSAVCWGQDAAADDAGIDTVGNADDRTIPSAEASFVAIVVAGANLGWPVIEGDVCLRGFADNQCTARSDLTAPVYAYGRGLDNCGAITGALANTRYDDAIFFSDRCSGQVWALTSRSSADWHVQEVARFDYPVAALAADANGDVYVLTHGHGGVFRLDFGE